MKKIYLILLMIFLWACSKENSESFKGGIFLSQNQSAIDFDDLSIEDVDGNVIYQDDFSTDSGKWQKSNDWKIVDGVARVKNLQKTDTRLAIYDAMWEASVIKVKALKNLGNQGLIFGFSAKNDKDFYALSIGNDGKTSLIKGGFGIVAQAKNEVYESLPTGEELNIKIELKGNKIKCYINNELVIKYKISSSKVADAKEGQFLNPIGAEEQRPDPFVYKHIDGYYYGMHTVMDEKGYTPKVVLYKSKTLSDLYTKGEKKYVFEMPKGQWNSANVWDPEIYYFDGTWYIYYSLSTFKMGVLSNKSPNPMEGEWIDQGRILENEAWAIDGSIFKQNNKMYMVWSGIPAEGMQRIYIREMSSPTTFIGDKLELSKPEYEWERQGAEVKDVNEGPIALQRNGKTFIVYSGSFCVTEYYKLGMLTIDDDKDPMIKENWTKSDKPVFEASDKNEIWGPGHNSFTTSPDGKEDWIVYHALTKREVGGKRYLMMQEFKWNKDGTPNFGTPKGRKKALDKPSGE